MFILDLMKRYKECRISHTRKRCSRYQNTKHQKIIKKGSKQSIDRNHGTKKRQKQSIDRNHGGQKNARNKGLNHGLPHFARHQTNRLMKHPNRKSKVTTNVHKKLLTKNKEEGKRPRKEGRPTNVIKI